MPDRKFAQAPDQAGYPEIGSGFQISGSTGYWITGRKILKKFTHIKIKKVKKESLILKLVKLQLSLKPELNLKINLNLEKYIQGFFDKISESVFKFKKITINFSFIFLKMCFNFIQYF